MLIHNLSYKGVSLSATQGQAASGNLFAVQKADLGAPRTSSDRQDRQLAHGIFSSPTLIRERTVDLEGVIISDSEASRDTLALALDSVFAPEISFSSSRTGVYPLYFTDGSGTQWYVNAKVLTPPEKVADAGDATTAYWKVSLLCDDPFIYSAATYLVSDVNRTQGVGTPFSFPASFTYPSYLTVQYGGGVPSPVSISIAATDDNATDGTVRIANLTSGDELLITGVTMQTGDVLIVDTANRLITLNGVDITAQKAAGSAWLYFKYGENRIVTDTNVGAVTCAVGYSYRLLRLT